MVQSWLNNNNYCGGNWLFLKAPSSAVQSFPLGVKTDISLSVFYVERFVFSTLPCWSTPPLPATDHCTHPQRLQPNKQSQTRLDLIHLSALTRTSKSPVLVSIFFLRLRRRHGCDQGRLWESMRFICCSFGLSVSVIWASLLNARAAPSRGTKRNHLPHRRRDIGANKRSIQPGG